MNTQIQEVLKMAIEALKEGAYGKEKEKVINACKEALEAEQVRQAQEPVCWIKVENRFASIGFNYKASWLKKDGYMPVYANPAQPWQRLADNDGAIDYRDVDVTTEFVRGALWADQKLKEKNT